MSEFEEIVKGQFEDPSSDPELVAAARHCRFTYGDDRAKKEAVYYELAAQHGFSQEAARELFVDITSNPPPGGTQEHEL